MVEALKYSKANIFLETNNNEFHITGPLVVTGEAQINWGKGDIVYVDASVTSTAVFTNQGKLTISASDGKLVNNSSATLFKNSVSKEFHIRSVDITSNNSQYGIWNEGSFSIWSDDESNILTEIAMKLIYNSGGSLTINKANISSNFDNMSEGRITINAGTITGNLNFPESQFMEEIYISISNAVTCSGTGWTDDARIKWGE